MSVLLNLNNRIVISRDDPAFDRTKDLLTIVEKELIVGKEYNTTLGRFTTTHKTRNVNKYLYDIDNDNLYVPYGIYKYIKYLFKNSTVKYAGIKNHPIMDSTSVVDNIEKYRGILPGISLYDNQLEALKQIFRYKRGVIQAGTGFGKTELMCASTQILKELNGGKYPTILVLEPTVELMKGIIKRFKAYKIPVNNYRETRMIFSNKVNIAHPISLCNDLENDKKLLDKVEVQFVDECLKGDTKIMLPDNKFVTIEEIYNNKFITEVMSYNFDKNIYEPKKIVRKMRQDFNDNFWKITYTNPLTNKDEYLCCTNNHKIWTYNRGYVRCDELTTDDYLKIHSELLTKIRIKQIKKLKNKMNTYKYNIEVEDNHNYWANGILVSNCHHSQSFTFSTPTQHMANLMYSIGLSATFLSHYHVDGEYVDDFSYEELRRLGACGPIIMKVDGKELIEENQLATPKLCILNNQANEEIDETKIDYTWHNVNKIRLQSNARTKLIAQAAVVFAKHGYKVIILMNVLDWGRRIMSEMYNMGYGDLVRTCFGGQTYEKCNRKTGRIEKEWNNTLDLFDKNKIKVIVGSSAIQEGVDLSRVDVCILGQGGKSDRTCLQSVGRALRKSKTGKYSWIVDINDLEDDMLQKQFNERMTKYKKVLGLTSDDEVFMNLNPETLEQKFIEWENIK